MKQRTFVGNGRASNRDVTRDGAPGGTRLLFLTTQPALQGTIEQTRGPVERQVEDDLTGHQTVPTACQHDEPSALGRFDPINNRSPTEVTPESHEPFPQALGQDPHAAARPSHPPAVRLEACRRVRERHRFRPGLRGILE